MALGYDAQHMLKIRCKPWPLMVIVIEKVLDGYKIGLKR